MIEKFVVFNPTTKEYFKRGYGTTADPVKARIYNRPNHASNSLKRKHWTGDGFAVYPIQTEFPMLHDHFDTYKAVGEGITIPFSTVVDYFRQLYFIDIAGTKAGEFPMSVGLIDLFYAKMKFIKGFGNGDNVMVNEKTFETDKPLHAMIGAEILKMFGYDTQGQRVAMFKIDWFDAAGVRRGEDY